MVDSSLGSRDSEGDSVISLITMHEDGGHHTLANADLVFDAATHAQKAIEAICGIDIFLTDNTVAQSARSGLEATMHPASRMERFARLHFWPVEDLDRRPVWIVQLENFEHVTFRGLVFGADSILYSCFRQPMLHLGKFLGACHSEAQVRQVVAAVGM